MRNAVLKIHVSLDGFIRDGAGDPMHWIFRTYDDQLRAWEVDTLWQAGVHVMGRGLYEEMAAYWPGSSEPYAPPMNEIPKVVFSRTLKGAAWRGTRVAGGDLAEEFARLKREPGKDILVHGGAALVQSLARLRLIDEYRLLVHPVVLAGDLALFRETMDLALIDTRSFPCGTVLMTYRPA